MSRPNVRRPLSYTGNGMPVHYVVSMLVRYWGSAQEALNAHEAYELTHEGRKDANNAEFVAKRERVGQQLRDLATRG